jgi:serine/threonine-protein kinase HipA
MDTLLLQTPAQLSLHLKALRRNRGLTQAQLASRLGIKQARYAFIESHPETVSAGQLLDVFAALQVDMLLRPRHDTKAVGEPRGGLVSVLGVWMNGHYVGEWRQVRGGRDQFRYDPAWLEDPQARALSLSLPITASATITSPAVRYYFDNLLPDDPRIRERLKTRFSLRSIDTFDLLQALGRDCVGAVQLLPIGEVPEGWNRITADPLKPRDVEAILAAVPTAVAPVLRGIEDEDGFRISIAGGQEKTALLKIGNIWHLPRRSTPTSHILKLPLGIVGGLKLDLTHSVDNEWLCAALLAELGFNVASTDISRFGEQRVLILERFDRRWQEVGTADPKSARFKPPSGAWLARLPQEDLCQATGVPYDRKYEADGGPGIPDILAILARAEQSRDDRRVFALAQLAFWMLAAIDGHAKNFSIFHRPGGTYGLTPLYDVVSAWPVMGHGANKLSPKKVKLAMALRDSGRPHYKRSEIHPRHFEAFATSLGDPEVWAAMIKLAEDVSGAIERVGAKLPEDFAPSVWTSVTNGLKRQAAAFLRATARSSRRSPA